ncbi:MAG: hypothetical protein ACXW08_06910 [Solirubrobacteraceae bacterium]
MGWLQLAAGEAPPWLAEVAGLVMGAALVAYEPVGAAVRAKR